MRNRSPRSFTVEVKSGVRDQRTIIPHRAAVPTTPRPAVSWPPPAQPQAPAAEPRRILPSLIAPEPTQAESEPTEFQPERMQVPEERSPRPRRGRSPKAKPIVAEMAKEPVVEIAATAPALAPEASEPKPLRFKKSPTALPSGERWKRRLGRWAR